MVKIDPAQIARTAIGAEKLPCGCEIIDRDSITRCHQIVFCGDGEACALTGFVRGFVFRIRADRAGQDVRA